MRLPGFGIAQVPDTKA